MKLPFPKDDDGKRMMMSGTSTGRKELIYELRETSLVGGNAFQRRDMVDKAVQFRDSMDLASGDPPDYLIDIPSNYDSFIDEPRYDSLNYQPVGSPSVTDTYTVGNTNQSTTNTGKVTSTSLESVNDQDDKTEFDNSFKGKANKSTETKNSTLAMVEDNKQPSFTANESNPSVPSPTEPSKTSTLRLSDRTRSESEDDIEKMDDPEQDGTIIGHKPLYKTSASAEDSPNSQKIDKNGNRSDNQQNEADNDCVVQCLYYTIQCCECIIL